MSGFTNNTLKCYLLLVATEPPVKYAAVKNRVFAQATFKFSDP